MRLNSSSHSSLVSDSIPRREVRQTSISSYEIGTDFKAIRIAASPTDRRFDLVPLSIIFPETEFERSIRKDRMVCSSRNTGSILGPPINGDASGEDWGVPNNTPCLNVVTFFCDPVAMAEERVAGISFPLLKMEERIPPLSSLSSSSALILSTSAGNTANLTPLTLVLASLAATLMAFLMLVCCNIAKSSVLLPNSLRLAGMLLMPSSYVQIRASAEPHH
mmetsp:Transcript_4048/g.3819  ORF Transcript_4048/g.3819 Transcript_4048/m.3819 type:complete len:220 (+) Transcript_4048:131-790(+)